MVCTRAPVMATRPLDLSAAIVRAIDVPVSGGENLGASSACGAPGVSADVLALYSVGPIDQCRVEPFSVQPM